MNYQKNHQIDEVRKNSSLNETEDINKYSFSKNKTIWICFLIILGILFFLSIFHLINIKKNITLTYNRNEQNYSDILINGLLNSENGKKFILSKIEELITNYEKNKNLNNDANNEMKNKSIETLLTEEFLNKKLVNDLKSNGKRNFNDSEEDIQLNNFSFLLDHIEEVSAFHVFISTHNKQYKTPMELDKRFQIFLQNYKKIVEHNKKNTNYKKDINQFSDLSEDEFKSLFLNYKSFPNNNNYKDEFKSNEMFDLIEQIKAKRAKLNIKEGPNFDWRTINVISDVKNQGLCGSCWAFSIAGAIESQYAIKHHKIYNLSPQQLVDCSRENSGCNGGNLNAGYRYVYNEGICTDDEYKYIGMVNTCDKSKCSQLYKIYAYFRIPPDMLKDVVNYLGPVSASLGVTADFGAYKEGIYDGPCNDTPNHAILIVGYGEQIVNNTKKYYYILKNSWGVYWGEKGYMRIVTNENGTFLKCNLGLLDAFIPMTLP